MKFGQKNVPRQDMLNSFEADWENGFVWCAKKDTLISFLSLEMAYGTNVGKWIQAKNKKLIEECPYIVEHTVCT